jgi:hypothetical protein
MKNGVIFSDGSYCDGKATYAILAPAQPRSIYASLDDIDYSQIRYSSGFVEGSDWDMNSYRAELHGIMAAIEFMNRLCNSLNIVSGRCTLSCDSKGALSAAFGHKQPTPRWSSFDLVRQIRNLIRISPILWGYKHIKGHQDAHRPFKDLDCLAQGNSIVDHLASNKLKEQLVNPRMPKPHTWLPCIGGKVIRGDLSSRIRYGVFRPMMEDRWLHMTGVPPLHKTRCDMNSFFHSLAEQPSRIYFTLIKFNAHLLPVGKNLLRRKHSNQGTCPGCGSFEDHEHLLTCTHQEMTTQYKTLSEDINDWLANTTSHYIRNAIMGLLAIFRHDQHTDLNENNNALYTMQLQLGRNAFFAGIWHTDWLLLQEQYHTDHKIKRSSAIWLVQLIKKIQVIPIQLWSTRNSILHDNSANHNLQAQHEDLNSVVDSIFAN